MHYLLVIGVFVFLSSCANSVQHQQSGNDTYADGILIDVRTPEEFSQGSVEGAINIPLQELANRMSELPENKEEKIVFFCLSGRRSANAKSILDNNGYTNVINGGTYKIVEQRIQQEEKQKTTKS